jgi:hypothetical protein
MACCSSRSRRAHQLQREHRALAARELLAGSAAAAAPVAVDDL